MPTIPGGVFDDPTLDADQGALVSTFLDNLGISELVQ
jgi:hypothetical protein